MERSAECSQLYRRLELQKKTPGKSSHTDSAVEAVSEHEFMELLYSTSSLCLNSKACTAACVQVQCNIVAENLFCGLPL